MLRHVEPVVAAPVEQGADPRPHLADGGARRDEYPGEDHEGEQHDREGGGDELRKRRARDESEHPARALDALEAVVGPRLARADVDDAGDRPRDEEDADDDARGLLRGLRVTQHPDDEQQQQDRETDGEHAERPRDEPVREVPDRTRPSPPLARGYHDREAEPRERRDALADARIHAADAVAHLPRAPAEGVGDADAGVADEAQGPRRALLARGHLAGALGSRAAHGFALSHDPPRYPDAATRRVRHGGSITPNSA